MVEAVDIYTVGLGGDSEVHFRHGVDEPRFALGPRRAMPLCALAVEHESLVLDVLDRQLKGRPEADNTGRFAVLVHSLPGDTRAAADGSAHELALALAQGPRPVDELIRNRTQARTLNRLIAIGAVLISAVTPTDAAHVLGLQASGIPEAANLGLRLLARGKDNRGVALAQSARALAEEIIACVHDRCTEVFLDVSLPESLDNTQRATIIRFLKQGASYPRTGTLRVTPGLDLPLIGVGAGANLYYPPVAQRLHTTLNTPRHADVANAVGAVVGRISLRRSAVIMEDPAVGFRLHAADAPSIHASFDAALAAARAKLREAVTAQATLAGAADITVSFDLCATRATVEHREIVVEAELTATASGRPGFAV